MADKAEVKGHLKNLEQDIKKQKELDEKNLEQTVQQSARNSKGAAAFNEAEQDEKARRAEEYEEEYRNWIHQINELKSGGRRGMDTFESAMHEILAASLSMHRVLNMKLYPEDQFTYKDLKKNAYRAGDTAYNVVSNVADHLNPTPFRPNVRQFAEAAMQTLGSVPQEVRDYYEKRVRDAKRVEPGLPAIQPIFTVAADGTFKMSEFKRDDGKDFNARQKATLEFAVKAWLEESGYDIKNDKVVRKDDGSTLTREGLIILRDDENHGIAKFIREHSNLEVKVAEINTPSP